jgi:hypothetical protein
MTEPNKKKTKLNEEYEYFEFYDKEFPKEGLMKRRLKACRLGKKISNWKPTFNPNILDIIFEYLGKKMPIEIQHQIKLTKCFEEIIERVEELEFRRETADEFHRCFLPKSANSTFTFDKYVDEDGNEIYCIPSTNIIWKLTSWQTKVFYKELPCCFFKPTSECIERKLAWAFDF